MLLAIGLVLAWPSARAAEVVQIAAEDDWAPYSSVAAAGGQPVGFAVDLVREAFATQGVEVRFVGVPFARCMYMAKLGQVAGCFNATIVDDNKADYHWHPSPMFHEELAVFSRAGGGEKGIGLRQLEGKRVGYTLGYTYPAEFRQNDKILKFSAKSDHMLLDMLLARRVDYILINTAPAYLRLNTLGKPLSQFAKVGTLSVDGFWIAFTRAGHDGQRLAALFERGLAALRASGRYQAMEAEFRRRLGMAARTNP